MIRQRRQPTLVPMSAPPDNAGMFRADSDDRWHWSADVSPPLDFCVRALRRDGLTLAPFDRHVDGDGSLRERGLDPETWRAWVGAVMAGHVRMTDQLRDSFAPGRPAADRSAIAEAAEGLRRPAALCPGAPALRARLDAWWADYEPEGNRWKRAMTLEQHRDRLDPAPQRWLWQALLPLHGRLDTITVFLVDYPSPALLVVPPVACLIATDPSDVDGWGYARIVLRAAGQLAGA
jgi:hypothetical protein